MRIGIGLWLSIFLLGYVSPLFAKVYGAELCTRSGFECVKVKKNDSWERLFPDDHDRSIAMRVNRMNSQLYPGLTIAIPHHLTDADIMEFAPFPRHMDTVNEKLVYVAPKERAWGVYAEDGSLVRWGPLSAGASACPDQHDKSCHTTAGSYRVYSLGSSGCISHKYPKPNGGAPMPYCMFFNNGQALHGSPGGIVGYNASHGCVRLYVNDAEWLRYDFIEGPNANNKYQGTKVIVEDY
jgi:L,D-transpeptidase ErfK/SrfK